MCGIVGAVYAQPSAQVAEVLLTGLHRLEYRGYDSAGLALATDQVAIYKAVGPVKHLEDKVRAHQVFATSTTQANRQNQATLGIAHTRWATHGAPSALNAHPHVQGKIHLVHNGIIENHNQLRSQLKPYGVTFASETDSEVAAAVLNLVLGFLTGAQAPVADCALYASFTQLQAQHAQVAAAQGDLLTQVVFYGAKLLTGAYGLVVFCQGVEDKLVVARHGSPLVIGLQNRSTPIAANYVASDPLAIADYAQDFVYLDDGDIALVSATSVQLYDQEGRKLALATPEQAQAQAPSRKLVQVSADLAQHGLGDFDSWMRKEIYEQPEAIARTVEGLFADEHFVIDSLGQNAREILAKTQAITILACGTSYHAGLVAKYWFEGVCGIPTEVEIASEFRYRSTVSHKNDLIIAISQSGETADTLAALRKCQGPVLAICNVPSSSLVRQADLKMLTRCGVEVGVASTKAFTSQLALLLCLVSAFAQLRQEPVDNVYTGTTNATKLVQAALAEAKAAVTELLAAHEPIKQVAHKLTKVTSALFLGRDLMYPIAKEGDLKLKEISYIHSEAFAGGELKHGPLALVDQNMPVIALAPDNHIAEKMHSNIHEVLARKGQLYVFTDTPEAYASDLERASNLALISMPKVSALAQPFLYTVALQLLSYYTAVARGCNVDKPRNLAKSVTVE